MTKLFIQIHNAETGEDVVREMNDTEFAAWQASQSDRDAEQAARVRTASVDAPGQRPGVDRPGGLCRTGDRRDGR